MSVLVRCGDDDDDDDREDDRRSQVIIKASADEAGMQPRADAVSFKFPAARRR